MGTGRRVELVTYLSMIGVNLLVLPTWFTPGRVGLPMRLALAAASAVLIAFCGRRVAQILGVNPLSRRRPTSYAPYELDDEEEAEEESFSERRRRLRGEARERAERDAREPRRFGQADSFREFDPYDEGPDPACEGPGPVGGTGTREGGASGGAGASATDRPDS